MNNIPEQTLNLAICGLGTVGSGVFNLLKRNSELMCERAQLGLHVAHVGARRDNPNCDLVGVRVSRDIFAAAQDPAVDVVLELIGGTSTAKDLVVEAIKNGKHVVTANKALIATHGNEIFSAAASKNVAVRFEAAVAGGIPVIKALQQGLAANQIDSIAGIINGTGNFILTEMLEKERSFEEALADAQALGYAEADPTFDVEGIDAAQKLVILAALAYGTEFNAEACFTEGIGGLQVDDIRFAEAMGYRIKHLGIAKQTSAGLELRVHPSLVPHSELIANVSGVMNAVAINGDAVGPTLFYGAGAGAEPTASAVLADVVDLAREISAGGQKFAPVLPTKKVTLVPIEAVRTAWYLRIPVQDKPGVLSEISQALSSAQISIQSLQQPDSQKGQTQLILISDLIEQSVLDSALATIQKLDVVIGDITAIRVAKIS